MIKFTLQERAGAAGSARSRRPGLGVWRKSRSGVRRFAVRQRVLELGEGASYRVAVQFRWYDEDGELLRRARRLSPACRQAGALPNLRVTRVGGRRVNGTVRYAVDVFNRGRAASSAHHARAQRRRRRGRHPGVRRARGGRDPPRVRERPACTGSVKAQVDPGDVVRRGQRARQLAHACPARCR